MPGPLPDDEPPSIRLVSKIVHPCEFCILTVPVRHNVIPEYLSDQPQQPVEVEVATLPDSGVTSRGYPHSRSAHRRVRREGIYDECCKKSCSYTQLKSYCE